MMGGHSGATADATYDFVPDGSTAPATRDIIATEACQQCHGDEFHGHGGDRLPGLRLRHLPQRERLRRAERQHDRPQGHDPQDPRRRRAAQRGRPRRQPVGDRRQRRVRHLGLPRHQAHLGEGRLPGPHRELRQVPRRPRRRGRRQLGDQARRARPASRATTPWTSSPPPRPTAVASSSTTTTASSATSRTAWQPINEAHDWTTKDPRNIPEFTLDVTMSRPRQRPVLHGRRGPGRQHRDQDATPATRSTTASSRARPRAAPRAATRRPVAPDADGKFGDSSMFVHGPRASNSPVLTTGPAPRSSRPPRPRRSPSAAPAPSTSSSTTAPTSSSTTTRAPA